MRSKVNQTVYWVKEVMVYTHFRPGKKIGKIIINEEKMGRGIGYHWRRYVADGELQEGNVEDTLLKAMRWSQMESLDIAGKKWQKTIGKPSIKQ
jgi:hypothetical protein